MNIPNIVKVGGVLYTVKVVDEIIDSVNPVGRIIPRLGVIELRSGTSQDYMNTTFIHELIHAIHEHMGLGQTQGEGLSEDYVDGFANALYMVLKDNPKIFSERTSK